MKTRHVFSDVFSCACFWDNYRQNYYTVFNLQILPASHRSEYHLQAIRLRYNTNGIMYLFRYVGNARFTVGRLVASKARLMNLYFSGSYRACIYTTKTIQNVLLNLSISSKYRSQGHPASCRLEPSTLFSRLPAISPTNFNA